MDWQTIAIVSLGAGVMVVGRAIIQVAQALRTHIEAHLPEPPPVIGSCECSDASYVRCTMCGICLVHAQDHTPICPLAERLP